MSRKIVLFIAVALVATGCYGSFDFEGDAKADLYYVESTNGDFYRLEPGGTGTFLHAGAGFAAPGDFDGNGHWEIASEAGGTWTTTGTKGTLVVTRPVKSQTAWWDAVELVQGDYDGDHATEPAYYRDSDATWFIDGQPAVHFGTPATNPNSNGGFGADADVPVPADYDGDGKTDLATWNPRTTVWQWKSSKDGTISSEAFGAGMGFPVPADYDGDHKADRAFMQLDATFQIEGSPSVTLPASSGSPYPAVADFDGDGKADPAYADLPLNAGAGHVTPWHIHNSADGTTTNLTIPASSQYVVPTMVDNDLVINTARITLAVRCHYQPGTC